MTRLKNKTTTEIQDRIDRLSALHEYMRECGYTSYNQMDDRIERTMMDYLFPGGQDIFDSWNDPFQLEQELRSRVKR